MRREKGLEIEICLFGKCRRVVKRNKGEVAPLKHTLWSGASYLAGESARVSWGLVSER